MAQTIKLKRSATQGAIPTTAQLDLGEMAVNTYDGKVFIKKDDGTESIVEVTGGGSSQTPSELLADIKTVDGTGSGLDADLLDGNHASAFATSAQGALADSALQSGDNISELTNNSGYITGNQTITLSGDVSGSGTTSIVVTVADDSHNHIISNIDGLQTALDGKVDDSQVLTNVPSGAVFTDTTYSVGNGGLTEINFTSALNSKLAGIETGATADQTASEILTAIKTVDGAGSGLDADLLDGQQGTYYYPASNPNGYTTNVGDITGVTAGTGLTGGGTSGSVTVNVDATISPATATELSSSTDLNNLNGGQAGFYYQTANADTTGNNYPNGNAGSLIVQKSAGNATQLYQTYSSSNPELFFRSNYTTGYGSWMRVWNSGNDGSGSGLDADLLDGQQGSYYLNTSTSHSGDVTGTYNNLQIAANVVNANELNVSGNGTSGQFLRSDGDGSFNWYTLPSYLTGNQTITLSGDLTGSGTTSINAQIAANVVGANELNVSGNGTAGQVLQSDGDGSMTWATPSSGVTTGKAIAMAIVFG